MKFILILLLLVLSSFQGIINAQQTPKDKGDATENPNTVSNEDDEEQIRAIIGFEQSGASAQNSRRNLFFDFNLSTPLPTEHDAASRIRLWGNIRVTSVPNPKLDTKSLREFVTTFNDIVADTPVNEVAQAFETTAGVEFRFTEKQSTSNGQRFTGSVIVGGGIIAPLSPFESGQGNIFRTTPEAVIRYPQAAGKDFIAFVAPDRDRFFREYFVGLRLKTFYLADGGKRQPGVLDVTFGQNEAISGGRLRGGILRFDGFYPLPISIGKAKNFIYLYGTAQIKLAKANIDNNPLILEAAPSGTAITGANAAIVVVPTINRDYYRIGVGIDPLKLFKSLSNKSDENNNKNDK